MTILLVEDDTHLSASLKEFLQDHRYTVNSCFDGTQALAEFALGLYGLVILDLSLPDIDGIKVCRRLRVIDKYTPIIVLTARDTTVDKVMCLDAGADDYIVKPFDLLELLARIRTQMRRAQLIPQNHVPAVVCQDLIVNTNLRKVTYRKQVLSLTPKEYEVLEVLAHSGTEVVKRSTLLEKVWQDDPNPGEDALYVTINTLRQKLRKAGAPDDFIDTVYKVGYRIKE